MLVKDINMPEVNLPYNGKIIRAPTKRFRETIIFVPFFGADQKNLQRHAEFVGEVGFDCVQFDLNDDWGFSMKNFISSKGEFGLKHIWADQIEEILNLIQGPKILYTFSNPSASAYEATANRNAWDIKAIISDGGPSGKLADSMINFFSHEQPLPTYPLRFILAYATAFLWNPQFSSVIHQDLSRFPKGFRLLSIRGWKDPLISPAMIDMVFEPHHHIDWEKLSLPEATHLNGLKDFPSEYKPAVEIFLKDVATEIVAL